MGSKVSVIIAVYNAERYLRTCLDSIVGQSLGLDSLEVILVDDASTDTSSIIIDEYEERYRSFKAIHLAENSGSPGYVRNIGLSHMSGDWVYVADNDDWFGQEAFELLLKHALEWNSEMVHGRTCNVDRGRIKGTTKYFSENSASIPNASLKNDGVLTSSLSTRRLVSADLINRCNIVFPEDSWYEDIIYSLRVLFNSRKNSLANDYNYYFWRKDASLTSLGDAGAPRVIKRPQAMLNAINDIFDLFDEHSKDENDYVKPLVKVFTHPVKTAFRNIDEYVRHFPEEYPDGGESFKRAIWDRADTYYTPELKKRLPASDSVRFDMAKRGVFDPANLELVDYVNPRKVRDVSGSVQTSDIVFSRECSVRPSKVASLLQQKTFNDLYRKQITSFDIEAISIDECENSFQIRGTLWAPLMVTERWPLAAIIVDPKGKLMNSFDLKIHEEAWGEPHQLYASWVTSISYSVIKECNCEVILHVALQDCDRSIINIPICSREELGMVVEKRSHFLSKEYYYASSKKGEPVVLSHSAIEKEL